MPGEGPNHLDSLFEDLNLTEASKQSGQDADARLHGRAAVALEIAFESGAEAVRAYSETVGVGQIAIITKDVFPKGIVLSLKMRVPGWTVPLVASGKVTWSRPEAMGIAFTSLRPEEQERLRRLILDHTTKLERVRRQFSRMMEQPVPAKVTGRFTTLVQLEDEMLSDAVSELLNEGNVVAVSDPDKGSRPNLIVADMASARPMADVFRRVPVVMVNASGPNELALNHVPFLHTKAFVPRPATPAKIFQAVGQLIRVR